MTTTKYVVSFKAGGKITETSLELALNVARKRLGWGMTVGKWDDGVALLYTSNGVCLANIEQQD